jgi:flagellar basal-body rod protein FlgC
MSLNGAMRASARGLTAERMRMDLISVNLANANSMRTPFAEAYQARVAVLSASQDGPKIERIELDRSDFRRVNDPGNPLADGEGFVTYTNVNPINQMVDMMSAQRSYEANIAAFNAAKTMNRSALSIGRV